MYQIPFYSKEKKYLVKIWPEIDCVFNSWFSEKLDTTSMNRRDAMRVLQSVFDDFDTHYDPDARLTAPLVEFEEEDEGNNFVLDW